MVYFVSLPPQFLPNLFRRLFPDSWKTLRAKKYLIREFEPWLSRFHDNIFVEAEVIFLGLLCGGVLRDGLLVGAVEVGVIEIVVGKDIVVKAKVYVGHFIICYLVWGRKRRRG